MSISPAETRQPPSPPRAVAISGVVFATLQSRLASQPPTHYASQMSFTTQLAGSWFCHGGDRVVLAANRLQWGKLGYETAHLSGRYLPPRRGRKGKRTCPVSAARGWSTGGCVAGSGTSPESHFAGRPRPGLPSASPSSPPAEDCASALVSSWANGLPFRSGDGAFNIHVGGIAQIDSTWLIAPNSAFALTNNGGTSGVGCVGPPILCTAFSMKTDFKNDANCRAEGRDLSATTTRMTSLGSEHALRVAMRADRERRLTAVATNCSLRGANLDDRQMPVVVMPDDVQVQRFTEAIASQRPRFGAGRGAAERRVGPMRVVPARE